MKNKKLSLNFFAIVFIVATITFWFFIIQQKHVNFKFDSGDTAVAEQAIWNATHGNGFQQSSLLTTESNFREHLNFVQFIYLPFYFIAPHTLTLYLVIYLFYGVASFFIFVFAKNKIGTIGGFLTIFVFLFQPLTAIQAVGPMHVVAISAPLLLLSFIYYEKKFYKIWLILIFLTAFTSEFIAPTIFLIALIAIIDKRNFKWILPPLLFSLIMYFISSLYITLGLSAKEELFKKITLQSIKENITKKRFEFVEINFLRPLFYLTFFFSKYSILLIPSLLLALFIATRMQTGAHIFAPVSAILTMLFIDVSLKINNLTHRRIFFSIVLIGTLLSSLAWSSYFEIESATNKNSLKNSISMVKDGGSVTAFRQVGHYVNKREEFYLPDNKQFTDYIILKSNKDDRPDEYEQSILNSLDYEIVFNENRIKVYVKKQKLSELLKIPIKNLPTDKSNLFDMLNSK